MRKSLVLFLFLFFAPLFSSAAKYKLDPELSFITISGTSTLHDWTVNAEKIKGSLNAFVENSKLKTLDSVNINIPVTYLKSGKESMDENMYNALKSVQFPEINYNLKNITGEAGELIIAGFLSVAGISKSIYTKVNFKYAEKKLIFHGNLNLYMSAFGITPPELFLGTLKTGDKVLINYYFVFSNS